MRLNLLSEIRSDKLDHKLLKVTLYTLHYTVPGLRLCWKNKNIHSWENVNIVILFIWYLIQFRRMSSVTRKKHIVTRQDNWSKLLSIKWKYFVISELHSRNSQFPIWKLNMSNKTFLQETLGINLFYSFLALELRIQPRKVLQSLRTF